ncbi:hypothetical protein [Methanobrevibacter sp.]|uniref:Cap15 family cyclic dinucleotide receptor domain-containing protein n=1 Tax=Methanobrevibacter sp. TaxID=66852 RepID=UPI0025FCD9F1|nr:hypothetical protein [Methanobrevibacter sp.]MBQ2831380.1 hypothetical protein [Methanobrevibacter sp.]
MHSYSIDTNNYSTILWFVTILSALLNAGLNIFILPKFGITGDNLNLQLLGLLISFFVSFNVIFWLFDYYIWKLSIINYLIKYPNISGKWTGTINNPDYEPIPTEVEIKQTWTKININLKTKTANSNTKALAFFVEDYDNPKLIYMYYNESETADLKSHGGTAKLEFLKSENVLKGDYYTDKHRTNQGTIYLKRKNIN